MITWLIGDNSFEVRETLRAIEAEFDGIPERIDGTELTQADIPDLLMGMSLFAHNRLVSITELSTNSSVWERLPEWLPRVNEDIHLVFIDAKPDRRTTSYKALKAAAEVKEFPAWSDRDTQQAIRWVEDRANKAGVSLSKGAVRHLVERIGVDQWQLAQAIDTLSLLDAVDEAAIDTHIQPTLKENIFQLFETALEGKSHQVLQALRTFSLHEDPYALYALLTSQALTLASVTFAEGDNAPAKDFGLHPFVASKFTRHAKRLGKTRVAHIVELFAKTDADMKRSKAEPWLLIERTLLQVAGL